MNKTVKTISFYRNVHDMVSLENYLVKDIIPLLLKQKGLNFVTVTSLFPMSHEFTDDFNINMIVENVFESESDLQETFYSDLGKEIMNKALHIPSGEITLFIGKEKEHSPAHKLPKKSDTPVKTIGFVQNIEDMNIFEAYIASHLLPLFLKQEGLLNVRISSLFPMRPDFSSELHNINMSIVNTFNSEENIRDVLYTDLGKQIMEKAINIPSGKISIFIGKEKRFYPV